MDYLRVTVGELAENCYVIYNNKKEAVLVDPGADGERIDKYLAHHELTPAAVILTHGHFDHIGAVDYFRKKYGIKAYVSEDEYEFCKDPRMNESAQVMGYPLSLTCDETFKDGDILPIFDGKIQAITTPGHTAGGACFYVQEMGRLFSGDTLFCHTVGRYDLVTGDPYALQASIREKLFKLPEETGISPGHGRESSIGHEKMMGTDDFI